MKHVLVAGGAGFIGSHLCERLLRDDHAVACIDDYSTGSRINIEHLRNDRGFSARCHDVTFPFDAQADAIINLACPASPIHYQDDAVRTLKTSVLGTMNLLVLAQRQGAPFLQASTSEVYGDPEVHPQPEHYCGHVNPIGRRACYDEGKRCAETLCFDYQRQYQVAIKVARIFNTYGPRMDPHDGRVVSNFIVQALRDAPITLYGDGTQTRSFCYVDDMVEALVRLMQSAPDFTGPVNLGNPEELAIGELAERIIRLTRSRSRLVFRPLPEDDPARRRPDISLARTRLSWTPMVPLDEGLARTVSYFQELFGRRRRPLRLLVAADAGPTDGQGRRGEDVIPVSTHRREGDAPRLANGNESPGESGAQGQSRPIVHDDKRDTEPQGPRRELGA